MIPVKLCCAMCGAWSVSFSAAEIWCGPSGRPAEFVSGECDRCDSLVLVKPSEQAIRTAAARVSAARKGGAMQKTAGGGGA